MLTRAFCVTWVEAGQRSSAVDQHYLVLDGGAGVGAVGRHEYVDLRANAELWQVDAGLDGEADTGDDSAGVVGLEPVQIDRLAVDLKPDTVTQPVGEVLAVAPAVDVLSGYLVGLPAQGRSAMVVGVLQIMERGVSCADDDLSAVSRWSANCSGDHW